MKARPLTIVSEFEAAFLSKLKGISFAEKADRVNRPEEACKLDFVHEAYQLQYQDYPHLSQEIGDAYKAAFECGKILEVVSELRQIHHDYDLFWIWPPALPEYVVGENGQTVRELVVERIFRDILDMKYDD